MGNLHLGLATLNLSLLLEQQGRSQQSYRRAQEAYDSFHHPTTPQLQDRISYLRIAALDHLLTLSIKLGISSHRLSSLALELANYIIKAGDSVWEVKDVTPETLPYYRARLLWELYRLLEHHSKSVDRARLTCIIKSAVEGLQSVEGQESIFLDALVDLDLHLRDVGRADRSLSGRIIAAAEKWMEVAREEDKYVTLNFLRLPIALVHSASDDLNEGALECATKSLERAIPLLKELGELYLQARNSDGKKEVQDRAPIPPEDVTQKQVVGYWLYALELQRALLLHNSAMLYMGEENQKRDQAKRALRICQEIKTVLSAYPESHFVRARLHNTEAFVEAYRVLGKGDYAKKELARYDEDWGASVMNPAYAEEEEDVVPVLLSGIWRLTRLKCLLYEDAKDAEGKAKWKEAVKEMEALMDAEKKEEGENEDMPVKVTAEDHDEVRQQLRQGALYEAYHPSIWRC